MYRWYRDIRMNVENLSVFVDKSVVGSELSVADGLEGVNG